MKLDALAVQKFFQKIYKNQLIFVSKCLIIFSATNKSAPGVESIVSSADGQPFTKLNNNLQCFHFVVALLVSEFIFPLQKEQNQQQIVMSV